MDKQVKKALLTAIGIASIAREKAEKIAKEAVKAGLLSRKEGTKLVQGFLKKAESESVRVHKILTKQVAQAGKKAEKRGKKVLKKAYKTAKKRGKKVMRSLTR
tara:strand:- start:237 stop:545 length:309 start_codon:yes stop_codon:yes gene_type:complete